ncbi:hypothetical protein K2W90_05250 [Candidatus Babeliales bacterium]|nr:hypothetical protein [Candidatus Babeliales bacterium]
MIFFYALFLLLSFADLQCAASETGKGIKHNWRKDSAYFQREQQLAPPSGAREFDDGFMPDWGLFDDDLITQETVSLRVDQAVDLCLASQEVPAQPFQWRKYLTKITQPLVRRVGSLFRGSFDYDFITPAGQTFRVNNVIEYRERNGLFIFLSNEFNMTIFFPQDSSMQEYEVIAFSDGDNCLFNCTGWQANNVQFKLDFEGYSLFFARDRNKFFDDVVTLDDDGMRLHFLNNKLHKLSFADVQDLFGSGPWRVKAYLESTWFIVVCINNHIVCFSKTVEGFPLLDREKLSVEDLAKSIILKESHDYIRSLPLLQWFVK